MVSSHGNGAVPTRNYQNRKFLGECATNTVSLCWETGRQRHSCPRRMTGCIVSLIFFVYCFVLSRGWFRKILPAVNTAVAMCC